MLLLFNPQKSHRHPAPRELVLQAPFTTIGNMHLQIYEKKTICLNNMVVFLFLDLENTAYHDK